MSWLLDAADDLLTWFLERLFPLLLLLVIAAVVIVVPVAIYEYATAETFELRSDEWQCSAHVERSSSTYIKSGDVMVPITTHYKHCTQWSEK